MHARWVLGTPRWSMTRSHITTCIVVISDVFFFLELILTIYNVFVPLWRYDCTRIFKK
jgi:hypothetical protein